MSPPPFCRRCGQYVVHDETGLCYPCLQTPEPPRPDVEYLFSRVREGMCPNEVSYVEPLLEWVIRLERYAWGATLADHVEAERQDLRAEIRKGRPDGY
jgi:hypothetical protein